VTPFDPVALVVMLVTFYPIVSRRELARARFERPDYFAGGVLFGTHGDKLRLPDGRIFDLIFNVDNAPGEPPRWQCIEPGPASDEPWPLEPGPLTPLDPELPPFPSFEPFFEPLVSAAIGAMGDPDLHLGVAQAALVETAQEERVPNAYEDQIEPAARALAAQLASVDALDPSGLITASDGHTSVIDDRASSYPNPDDVDPGEMPPGDAGPPPDDDGRPPEPEV
jgi:hypothetical protein